jgi:hypothetical protein
MSALPPIATSIAFFGVSALGHKQVLRLRFIMAVPALCGGPVRAADNSAFCSALNKIWHRLGCRQTIPDIRGSDNDASPVA